MTGRPWLFLFPLLVLLGAAGPPGESSERDAVERAVLDYVEALYEVDPTRIDRSVHPTLAKVGFQRREEDPTYRELRMSFDQLRSLSERWNRSGRLDPASAVKEVVVFEVLDQTATARLTADWGVDYLHLARFDGRWQIVNVLWQSPPRGRGAGRTPSPGEGDDR